MGNRIDVDTGDFVNGADGKRIAFLPFAPAASPPFELVDTTDPDPESVDGHRHHLIGGDPAMVEQVVAFYEKAGRPVPEGYAQAAADHAAAVEAAKQ